MNGPVRVVVAMLGDLAVGIALNLDGWRMVLLSLGICLLALFVVRSCEANAS